MGLKENLQAIKNSLSTEEQMIENFIKGERFIKKYKFIFLALIGLLFAYIVYYYASDILSSNAVQKNNSIFISLLENPNDNKKIELLKKNNPNLYVIFLMTNNDLTALEQANELKLNPLVKEIVKANFSSDSKFLREYNTILQAYELLKQGKIQEADTLLAQIPLDSALKELVNNFKHYKGIQ